MRADPGRGAGASRRDLALALALALATCLVFAPVLRNEFLMIDDDHYITGNPRVAAGLTLAGLRWALTSLERDNWQPLTWAGHMLAVEISGLRPFGHHLLSVGLHALAAALLLIWLTRATGRRGAALAVAALFALHPLRLESVAWASELKDPLSGVCFAAALLAHRRLAARGRARDHVALVAATALGLMAKPTLVALPPVLLLLDYWPLGRWSRAAAGRLVLEKAPLFALAAADAALTVAAQTESGAVRGLAAVPAATRLMNVPLATLAYVRKLLWPADLSAYYPLSSADLTPAAAAAAAAALLAATLLALRLRRSLPALAVGWLWFLAMLLPTSGIVQVGLQAMADRYTYLSQIGLGVALAWSGLALVRALAARDRPRLAHALTLAAAAWLAALAAATPVRAGVWRNTVRLFSDALARDPRNWFAHLKIAEEHLRKARVEEGLRHAEPAVALQPDFVNTRLVYGILLGRAGRERDAEAQFREALRLEPGWSEAQHHLGLALYKQGRHEEALAVLRQELAGGPDKPRALMAVAVVEEALGRLGDAEGHARAWARVDPRSAAAQVLLGRIAEARRDAAAARAAYEAALVLSPQLAEARAGLERVRRALPGGGR